MRNNETHNVQQVTVVTKVHMVRLDVIQKESFCHGHKERRWNPYNQLKLFQISYVDKVSKI